MQREEECAAWMRQGIDGDEAAYRQLLQVLGAALRVTVRHRFALVGMGTSDIEDVVQETLLALHLKRHTWKRDDRIGPWVAAITRNKLVMCCAGEAGATTCLWTMSRISSSPLPAKRRRCGKTWTRCCST